MRIHRALRTKRQTVPRWLLGLAIMCGTTLPGFAGESLAKASRLLTYDDSGKTMFALSLSPGKLPAKAAVGGVAVIVDTSASQNGIYRTESIEIAKAVVAGLSDSTAVSLFACDIEPVLLGSAATANDASIATGFEKLSKRIPLGTTDLAGALKAAAKSLPETGDRSIVYIGDGVHMTNLMNAQEFEALVHELTNSHTVVNSFAIGQKTDCELLSTLANHTGGRVFVRKNITGMTTQQMGQELASVALEPVFWPDEAKWPAGIAKSYPSNLPPLRSDRDSIYVGNLLAGDVRGTVSITGTVGGEKTSLKWDVTSEPNNPDLAFIGQIVTKASTNGGLMLPTAGSDALRDIGEVIMHSADELIQGAKFALHKGDNDAAIAIAEEALRRSPNNLEAKAIIDAAKIGDASTIKTVKPVKGPGAVPKIVKFVSARLEPQPPDEGDAFGDVVEQPPAAGSPFGDDTPNNFNASPIANDPYGELATAGDLLAADSQLRRVAAQALERDIAAELSRSRTGGDPSNSKLALKSLLDKVRRAPEIDSAMKVQLETRLIAGIQATAKAESDLNEMISRSEAVQASASATRRLLTDKERRGATIQQLVQRFSSLLEQQLYAAANNEIAPQIHELDRDSIIDRVVNTESNSVANFRLIMDAVNQRSRAFVDSTYQNELACIPYVDDVPVRFPPADVWQALSARRLERYGTIDLSGGNQIERGIFNKLRERSEISFPNSTLGNIVTFFREQYSVPIVLDDKALEEEGVTQDTPVNLVVPEISFRSALKLILEQLNLTYVIQDEVMRITNKKNSANVVRVYPVGDLVVPIVNLGGGMGGGMGGMGGGGMGGGGMGGGGMGGGGMGGGGMGGMGGGGMGGMGGGGMFDVNDQPTKSADKSAQPKNAQSVDPTVALQKLVDGSADERADAEASLARWSKAKLEEAKVAFEAKNDKLCHERFQEVVDVLGEAIRSSLPAPWMYEALSIAMQGCEYPPSEIRRVMLSSVDFGSDVTVAIKIARYFEIQGMKREAIAIYRDAHRASPTEKLPLEAGLRLGLELEDQDAIVWASTGILSQAWTDDHVPMIEKAVLAAQAAYIRLNQAGRKMEAYALEQEIKKAQLRDVVVRVAWTGNADIDISVEEPTGTVCNASNPRTTAGGLYLGDSSSMDKAAKDGYSETYVCANGFSGQYRIVIRKVWGEVAGGKVSVNIVTDYGTKDAKEIKQQVPLTRDAMVIVDVKNGHRSEPIAEAQFAKISQEKKVAGQAVLAQVDTNPTDPGEVSPGAYYQALLSRYASGNTGAVNGRVPPFFRNGAVGYRPIITVIPTGTFMTATAVISGDRRYVRITSSPNFMDILAVDTFNFVTGSGTNNGAGGGLGGGGAGGGGFGGGGAF